MKKLLFLLLMWGIGITNIFADGNPLIKGWSNLGSGVNGTEVNAIVEYNGDIIVGGEFTTAGGVNVGYIAKWDGMQWSSLAQGVNGPVDALAVFNGNLYVGGTFTTAGGSPANNIAKWDGATWTAMGPGLDGDVRAMIVYNSELVVGGGFGNAGDNIAKWNGTSWSGMGTGMSDDVHGLTIWQGDLVAVGRFVMAGGVSASRVARWNGSSWSAVSNQVINDRVFAVGVLNDTLYIGGKFDEIGTDPTLKSIAKLSGTTWQRVGKGVEDNKEVNALTVYKNELVVGGQFEHVYQNDSATLTVYSIARWDGSRWDRFETGMDERVSSLFTYATSTDTSLYAGGEFNFAGGRPANHIAVWNDTIMTYTVEGTVRYTSNNQPVNGGYVKAVRLELATREYLTLDSVQINPTDGTYKLNTVRGDTVDIIAFPEDVEGQDFIPTYHNGTMFWEGSASILLHTDTAGIDIDVMDAQPSDNPSGTGTINGRVELNYLPTGFLSGQGEEFTGGSNVYAELNGVFKNFDISDNFTNFTISSLPAGTYNIIVNRLGYESDTTVVTLSNGGTVNNVNFLINPMDNNVSVQNISNNIPDNITLYQNYPNPFNPTTKIRFDIKTKSSVTMYLYNSLGQVVRKMINNETYTPGSYELSLDASGLASGVYFYKLVTAETSLTKKMVVLK